LIFLRPHAPHRPHPPDHRRVVKHVVGNAQNQINGDTRNEDNIFPVIFKSEFDLFKSRVANIKRYKTIPIFRPQMQPSDNRHALRRCCPRDFVFLYCRSRPWQRIRIRTQAPADLLSAAELLWPRLFSMTPNRKSSFRVVRREIILKVCRL